MKKSFEKYKKILWKINEILGSLEQISEKFVGNIWLICLQFEKFSVIRVLTYYNLKELLKHFRKFYEMILNSRNFLKILRNSMYHRKKYGKNLQNFEESVF